MKTKRSSPSPGPSLEERTQFLIRILDGDSEEAYKEAARDLLCYYMTLLVDDDGADAALSGPEEDEYQEWKRLVEGARQRYVQLPIARRAEVERGVGVSTISRFMRGRTAKLRPLTKIKLETTLRVLLRNL